MTVTFDKLNSDTRTFLFEGGHHLNLKNCVMSLAQILKQEKTSERKKKKNCVLFWVAVSIDFVIHEIILVIIYTTSRVVFRDCS